MPDWATLIPWLFLFNPVLISFVPEEFTIYAKAGPGISLEMFMQSLVVFQLRLVLRTGLLFSVRAVLIKRKSRLPAGFVSCIIQLRIVNAAIEVYPQ